jgi:hypothetical protein
VTYYYNYYHSPGIRNEDPYVVIHVNKDSACLGFDWGTTSGKDMGVVEFQADNEEDAVLKMVGLYPTAVVQVW